MNNSQDNMDKIEAFVSFIHSMNAELRQPISNTYQQAPAPASAPTPTPGQPIIFINQITVNNNNTNSNNTYECKNAMRIQNLLNEHEDSPMDIDFEFTPPRNVIDLEKTPARDIVHNNKAYIRSQFVNRIELNAFYEMCRIGYKNKDPCGFIVETLIARFDDNDALEDLARYVLECNGDMIYNWICSSLLTLAAYIKTDTYMAPMLRQISSKWTSKQVLDMIKLQRKRLDAIFKIDDIQKPIARQFHIYMSAIYYARILTFVTLREGGYNWNGMDPFDSRCIRDSMKCVDILVNTGQSKYTKSDANDNLCKAVENFDTIHVLDIRGRGVPNKVARELLQIPFGITTVEECVRDWKSLVESKYSFSKRKTNK